jgi:hypothetical protein
MWNFRFSQWQVWKWECSGIYYRCSLIGVDQRFRGAYCIHHRVITLMMQAVCTSGTSVCSKTTWHYIPEGLYQFDMWDCRFSWKSVWRWQLSAYIITLMMETVCIYEMLVYFHDATFRNAVTFISLVVLTSVSLKNHFNCIGFEVLVVVKMLMLILCFVKPCGFVSRYEHLRWTYFLTHGADTANKTVMLQDSCHIIITVYFSTVVSWVVMPCTVLTAEPKWCWMI